MRKTIITLLPILGLLICGPTGCDRGDNPVDGGNPEDPLVFDTLTAESSSLRAGESSRITAAASGYRLAYHWQATLGDIVGSGAAVTYIATPCAVGTVTVSCTVTDGHGEERSRSLDLIVQ